MSEAIQFSIEGAIGVIVLNRPKALNALTLPMIKALQTQLETWEQEPRVQAYLIKTHEGKAFCAGGDVRWLYDSGLNNDDNQLAFFWHEYRLNHFISQLKKPYIALMNGMTMGGGVGISLHGSYPVATEQFVFAMPETTIGFFPDIGAGYLLSRCPSHYGIYLGLTGVRIDALKAHALGLVKYNVSSDVLEEIESTLYHLDLSKSPHQSVKQCLERFSSPLLQNALTEQTYVESKFQYDDLDLIMDALKSDDRDWSQSIYKTLEKKSPLSLKVTFEQLKRAKNKSLAHCLQMDYCLVQHFMKGHDFYEGVRALLVDKDKSPNWQPKQLSEVSKQCVETYFSCEQSLTLL